MTTHEIDTAQRNGRWPTRFSVVALVVSVAVSIVAPAGHTEAAPAAAVVRQTPDPGQQSTAPGAMKYYVVGEPVNGQREYLFAIAAKTLGNGNRYLEIFELNRGRSQPDGAVMVDPAVVNPGWVLQLPPDASGPQVRIGPLPTTGLAGDSTAEGAESDPLGSQLAEDKLIRTGALVLLVVLMAIALWLLRRGRSAGPTDTPAPAVLQPATPQLPARPVVPALPAAPAAPPSVSASTTLASVDLLAPAILTAEVVNGKARLTVRLAGVRGPQRSPAHRWIGVGDPPPEKPTTVRLGEEGDRTLWLDLALAPDVVTLTGPAPLRRELVRSLARQLDVAGTPVTVVGDVVGKPVPADCRWVESPADLTDSIDSSAPLAVVICPGSGPEVPSLVRRLSSRSHPRVVLILVGKIRPARWSIEAGPVTG